MDYATHQYKFYVCSFIFDHFDPHRQAEYTGYFADFLIFTMTKVDTPLYNQAFIRCLSDIRTLISTDWKQSRLTCKYSMFWLYVCSGVSIISNAVLTLGSNDYIPWILFNCPKCPKITDFQTEQWALKTRSLERSELVVISLKLKLGFIFLCSQDDVRTFKSIKVTCFVIGFPIIVSFPMLMFYDIICEICMPNSDTIFQSHVLDMFKIFLFLVVYLIPVVCSSRALLVTRMVFEC